MEFSSSVFAQHAPGAPTPQRKKSNCSQRTHLCFQIHLQDLKLRRLRLRRTKHTGAHQDHQGQNPTSQLSSAFLTGSAEVLRAHLGLVKGCLSCFPHCCDERPQKSHFRKEVFVLAHSLRVRSLMEGRRGGRKVTLLVTPRPSLIAYFWGPCPTP